MDLNEGGCDVLGFVLSYEFDTQRSISSPWGDHVFYRGKTRVFVWLFNSLRMCVRHQQTVFDE